MASELSGNSESFGLGFGLGSSLPFGAGDRIGPVTVVRLLGAGGMGIVYEATQEWPARRVAVKVLRLAGSNSGILRRFALEADLLARLQHPAIAQIHLAGIAATPTGEAPYLIMELIEGAASITEAADARQLGYRQRIAIFLEAVAAVAHAHRSGVVHRDLKPGNILVSAAGSLRVIDFGVARLLAPEPETVSVATQVGELVGTVRYMSPEQLGLDAAAIDQPSDVYSLGLVLHELLFHELPYELRGRSLMEATAILMQRTVSEPRPLARRLRGKLPTDEADSLAVILAKCLEPDPSNRYCDAGELHADLDRWLAGEPIRARPPTLAESVRRLARRHRAAAIAAVTTFAALLAAVGGISWFSLVAARQRLAAEQARGQAETAHAVAEAERREAHAQAAEARRQLYLSTVLLAAEARDRDNLSEARRLLAEAESLAAGQPGETPELNCLAASLDESLALCSGGDGTVQAVAWTAAADRVAIGTAGGHVMLWQPAASPASFGSGSQPAHLLTAHEGPVWAVAYSPDDQLLASASADGTVRITNVASGTLRATLTANDAAFYGVAFAPDGRLLATGSRTGTVTLWNTAAWEEQSHLEGHEATIFSVTFSPDGTTLLSTSRDGTARLWDVATRQQLLAVSHGDTRVFRGAFAADGQTFATAAEDATARLWRVADGAQLMQLDHPLRVNAVAFLPSGPGPAPATASESDRGSLDAGGRRHSADGDACLATASGDGLVRIWNLATGEIEATRRGHAAGIWALAMPNGRPLAATGSADESCRVWNLTSAAGPVLPLADRGLVVGRSPSGDRLAVGLADGSVCLLDPEKPMNPMQLNAPAAGRINDVVFAADGATLWAACDDGSVRRWSLPEGGSLPSLALHRRRVYSVAISPDGALLATAGEDRSVRLTDPLTGTERRQPLNHPRRVFSAAFHPHEPLLATACEDRLVRLWNLDDGGLGATLAGHTGPVNHVAFAPDGSRLASGSSDGTVRLWPTAGGQPTLLAGPARQIWKLAFSPGGTRLAACSADGTVQLWDVASGRPVATLRGHSDQVWGIAFTADGHGLFSASWDGTLRAWGRPATARLRHWPQ